MFFAYLGGCERFLCVEETVVSVRRLLTLRTSEEDNPWIEPHDSIRVSKAGVVYALGALRPPGGFPIKDQERMTVLRAVSLASGMERTAALQRARIIRTVHGEKTETPVELRGILSGKDPDPELLPNDILYVPDSRMKSALNRGAEAIVQMAVGVVVWRR